MPDATVTLRKGAETRNARTDNSGSFSFDRVSAGTYELQVEREGFKAATVRVTVGNRSPKALEIKLVANPTGNTKAKNIPIFDLMMEETNVPLPTTFDAFVGTTGNAASGKKTITKMIGDVREINMKLFTRNPGAISFPVKDRVQIEIEIKCLEPSQANAERSRKITAEANVGAKAL